MGLFDWLRRKKAPPETDAPDPAADRRALAEACANPFTPHMPEVDAVQDPGLFATARRLAAGLDPAPFGVEPPQEAVGKAAIVVTPGGHVIPYEVPAEAVSQVAMNTRGVLPDMPRRSIAVISYTAIEDLMANPDACIPFRGFLMSFACRGHLVWVFEGHPLRLAAGCRGADILLLDSGMLPYLQSDWQEVAGSVMRGNELWVHDREHYRLAKTTLGNVRSHGDVAIYSFREPPSVV